MSDLSYWNYRVMRKNGVLGIHGVYYDHDDRIISYDLDPNVYVADDLDDLRERLELMILSLDKEILDFEKLEAE